MTKADSLDSFHQTLSTPAEDLALDQSLFDLAEAGNDQAEWLRFWQPQASSVVMGRSGVTADEVHLQSCQADGIGVFRRISGGGTILTGKGCLMYSLVLSLQARPHLRDISCAHRFVGDQFEIAFASIGLKMNQRGSSDFCLGEKKFSGNALRVGRENLLYHGTLLIDFPLQKISDYLQHPKRQPDYRQQKNHLDFVTNLNVDPLELSEALSKTWGATQNPPPDLSQQVSHWVENRYALDEWNFRR